MLHRRDRSRRAWMTCERCKPDSCVHVERAEDRIPDRLRVFLPFLLIDLIVSASSWRWACSWCPDDDLAAPEDLMFVLIDGWNLVVGA